MRYSRNLTETKKTATIKKSIPKISIKVEPIKEKIKEASLEDLITPIADKLESKIRKIKETKKEIE